MLRIIDWLGTSLLILAALYVINLNDADLYGADLYGAEPAQPPATAVTVAKILKVEPTVLTALPPTLIVKVAGEVPTGGYDPKLVKLERVVYVTPPKDGVQDYRLTAVKPAGLSTQVLTTVTAADEWKDFEKEAPWLKGIRVLGEGDGIVEAKLPGK